MLKREVERAIPSGAVRGTCLPGFEPLMEAFVENFASGAEVGASLCVMIAGETVLDLWGGLADLTDRRPWEADTVSIVFSNTKAATALCAHLLAERGAIDLDAPVARYWPEFAQAGKAATTVRMLLDHTAGVPALRAPLADGKAFDWDYMARRLAEEEPFWEPGSRTGYHGLTFGWLVGEVVRRASGRRLGAFFREEIAARLGIDYWIGLPESEERRVAPIIPYRPSKEAPASRFETAVTTQPQSISALYFLNTGGWRPKGFNSRAGHAAEIGAAGGITNARGLAGFYAPLANGGRVLGRQFINPRTIESMTEISSATHSDATLCIPTRFAAGFMRSIDNRARGLDSVVLAPTAFGHVGAGGSIGFADPAIKASFGYTMNRMGAGLLLNDRGQRLIDTFRACMNGSWNSTLRERASET